MKNILIIVSLVFVTAFILSCSKYKSSDFIGSWKTVDGSLTFKQNDEAQVKVKGFSGPAEWILKDDVLIVKVLGAPIRFNIVKYSNKEISVEYRDDNEKIIKDTWQKM